MGCGMAKSSAPKTVSADADVRLRILAEDIGLVVPHGSPVLPLLMKAQASAPPPRTSFAKETALAHGLRFRGKRLHEVPDSALSDAVPVVMADICRETPESE